MKKSKLILMCVILFLAYINCNASVNTYTRTNENLYLPKDVVVTSENIDSIFKTPAVSSKEKIYDYANLFSDEEEELLYKEISDYISFSKFDLALVTVEDMSGKNISSWSYDFYDYNDFRDDGVVFVIYKRSDDPEIFMGNSGKNGSEIFSIYSDDRINLILSYIYPDIQSGNYYGACLDYIKILDGFYDKEKGSDYKVDDEGNVVKRIPWLEIIIISLSLTSIFIMFFLYKIKTTNKTSYSDYLDNKIDNDTLVVRKDIDEEFSAAPPKQESGGNYE